MKHIITLFFLIFFVTIGSAQNFYKNYSKKELKKLILSIDNDTTADIISLSDSILKDRLYLKCNLTGIYHNNKYIKIRIVVNNTIELISESYYFDKQGYLIYYIVEEHTRSILTAKLEIIFYGKNKLYFIMDNSHIKFNNEDKEIILDLIKDDLKIYKNQLAQ